MAKVTNRFLKDEAEEIKAEEVKEVEVIKEPKLREVVVTGISISNKQPWIQLGDPNPDVIVIVKPDGFTCTGKYKVVNGQWEKFK